MIDVESVPRAEVADVVKSMTRLFQAAVLSLALAGCSSAPGSHKTICTDHEALCVVAGIAVFGGIVAVMQESGGDDPPAPSP